MSSGARSLMHLVAYLCQDVSNFPKFLVPLRVKCVGYTVLLLHLLPHG